MHTSKTKLFLILLSLFTLLPVGCTPEEKTLLLPMADSSGEESEEEDSVYDFTVKKIYTYTYETREGLEKSAFLQGCGENEIRIISREEQDTEDTLLFRQVDYRYGFYDTLGEFTQFWEADFAPSDKEMRGDLYIEKMLPSPDGTQLLIYVSSDFWNNHFIWLYSMDGRDPLLLYEGSMPELALKSNTGLIGSFSESGRWVTFDAAGLTSGTDCFVPVYDCRKDRSAANESKQKLAEDTNLTVLNTPDQKIYFSTEPSKSLLLAAAIYDQGENAGLLSLYQDGYSVYVRLEYPDPEKIADAYEDSSFYFHSSCYLYEYEAMPYLQYLYDPDMNHFYYLGNPAQLCTIDMSSLTLDAKPFGFPELVWNFLPLDSGDLLVVLAKEQKSSADPDENVNSYMQSNAGIPPTIQDYWNIRSADLYLYPKGSTEGQLLYKNLRNLVAIEYDAATNRILLETQEGESFSYRKCIILQL